MTKGIDVSQWQGYVDFNNVKNAGYDFVILRAGYGKYTSQIDPTFERNYANAKAAGLNVGAYWYSYAKTASDASKEADVFLAAIKGKQFEYPVAFDIEDPSQADLPNNVIDEICTAFCDKVEKAGYYVCLYSYPGFISKISSDIRTKYDVWIANFTTASKPSYNGPYGIWQHSSTGKVSGISGNVDLNIAYKDYPTIIKQAGLNGFEKIKMEPKATTKSSKSKSKSKGSGDVNGDGKVNTTDIALATAAVKGKKKLTEEQKDRADVNADGKVDTKDVEAITEKVAPPKSEPAPKWINYTVKKGDTLYDIAKRYGVSIVEIAKDNNIKNVNLIYASQKLKIRNTK